MGNRNERISAFDEQTRVSGFVYIVMMAVAAAFAGLVWSIYAESGVTERIAAPNAPYKVAADTAPSADPAEVVDVVSLGPSEAEAASPEARTADAMPVFVPNGPFVAQVAALQSEEAVDAAWKRLSSRSPNVFGPAQLDIERADLGARGIYYRVRAGYFPDRTQAENFCDRVKRLGQDCIVSRR